ncbi:hypothetical protein [Desulfosediminicola sp.]|uniref:hypothetical protein n=1 Tax=Desulfosediminicola sp. TaxID=2886825 RepID=UPI003AF299E6
MNATFRSFMTSLIDYAGLFPPAALDISHAEKEYRSARQSPHGWMLGRFIISAARLQESGIDNSFPLSVLIPPDGDSADYAFLKRFGEVINAVETTIPGNCLSRDRCLERIVRLHNFLKLAGIGDVKLFFESSDLETATDALAIFNGSNRATSSSAQAGFKLRCGGVMASAFPSVKKVATAITLCKKKDVPIKFTAGLHHPLRNVSSTFDIMQHGFLNIFFATLLYQGEAIEQHDISACLTDENDGNFTFAPDGIHWRNHFLPLAELKRFRTTRVISFGSCSFAEPLEGLKNLGLLTDNVKA